MQNIPDKGVSRSRRYLKADDTVTGLTGMAHESQGQSGRKSEGVSILGHGVAEIAIRARETFYIPSGYRGYADEKRLERTPMTSQSDACNPVLRQQSSYDSGLHLDHEKARITDNRGQRV
jgi:hypothetical protein